MPRLEIAQARHQPSGHERRHGGERDLVRLRHAPHLIGAGLEALQDSRHFPAVAPAGLGEFHRARSALERDKHPAAAYLRRPIQHTPVISFRDAARFIDDPATDPHAVAEDYIPVTTSSHRVFAIFISDGAVDLAFPKDSLVVIDYADRRPTDGTFCLSAPFGFPILRRWRSEPARLEPHSSDPSHRTLAIEGEPRIIGCARVSIRFH